MLALKQRLEQFKITDKQFDAFTVPVSIREGFSVKWAEALAGEPKLLAGAGHRMILPVSQSRLGGVWLEASVKNNQAELWLCVGDPHEQDETDEDGEPLWTRVPSGSMKGGTEEKQWLDKVWTVFNPVRPLKAEKIIQPNSKCNCGSGRKFKKCCMLRG